jgi:hypothetical protein
MLAIVLTCDRYRALTEHMIHCYNDVWSRHPFLFCVPYQAVDGINSSNSRYVRTPPRIKETVLNLLMDLEDEQWVYWCIDDKYPMQLKLERIEPIVDWLSSELSGEDISGLLFCRCRSLLHSDNLTGNRRISKSGEVLLERRAYHQIWIHQFLRVKVLRYLFRSFPDEISSAKTMDTLLLNVQKPASHRLFVTRDNLAIFGESTSRGEITKNCYESIRNKKLPLCEWTLRDDAKEIIMGRFDLPGGRSRMTELAREVRARVAVEIDREIVLQALIGRWRGGASHGKGPLPSWRALYVVVPQC